MDRTIDAMAAALEKLLGLGPDRRGGLATWRRVHLRMDVIARRLPKAAQRAVLQIVQLFRE